MPPLAPPFQGAEHNKTEQAERDWGGKQAGSPEGHAMMMGISFRQARYRAAAVTWQRVLCLATPQREAATEDLDGRHRGAGVPARSSGWEDGWVGGFFAVCCPVERWADT
ncbi:hypothetical protein V501_06189 [Pseudogymnoascus sp. VKM F-4519 (FW-2642)]|nr:hypothetical protein V501_06189 [Pseudogymnoascus sp. VKM F-4519 (FW-2642)]